MATGTSHSNHNVHSLTPIASKTLESIILNMVKENIDETIKRNQFGGMGGASTTDALEMIHRWSEATDKLDHYVKVALLDFSQAFELINYNILLVQLKPHIGRWIATFLLDRTQQVKIGNNFSPPGNPKGGVPQGTLLGPKCFLVCINDLETPAPNMVNEKIEENINCNQFCGMGGASTTDDIVEMIHRWSEATDKLDNYVIVALLDFRPYQP